MKTKTGLEKYFDDYMKKHDTGLKYDSFTTYIDKASDESDSLGQEIERAYLKMKLNGTGALFDKGLGRSGYRDYLEKRKKSDYEAQTEAIKAAEGKKAQAYANNYASYLDSLLKKNESFKNTVANELINKKIANEADAVKYAMERGLSKTDALNAARLSYTTLKNKLASEIIKLAVRYEIDEITAENMALSFGLTSEDAKKLGVRVKNLSSAAPPSDSVYDEYENIAGKDSESDIFK